MNHIDLSSVLRQTLACDLYSNLVTRPTGAAVRGQIEEMLDDSGSRALTVIDFSHVSMIDLSCADEVVAKLLLRYGADNAPREAYFLFRGVTEHHHDAIEAVLERHELVAALEEGDGVRLVGTISDDERQAWDATCSLGDDGGDSAEVALQMHRDVHAVEQVLATLCRRRVMMRIDDRFVPVGPSRGG
ncbi:MAG TPA: hypothetical protein VGM82_20070 [Gemmatimonadaceae bacterium]|jgi:hypothetical protein